MASEKRTVTPGQGGRPKAGDLQNLGPLGRPMRRDELVDGPDARGVDEAGNKTAGNVEADGGLDRPMTRDELVDGKRPTDGAHRR